MGHNVGKAADIAVKNSQRVKGEEVTPEQNIKFLRDNLRAGLHVPSHQIQALLDAYDHARTTIAALQNTIEVYEID